MDRTVRVPALCSQSIHTVAVPDVDKTKAARQHSD